MRTYPVTLKRSGFTLIELLVVVVILITITAIALPLMSQPIEERQIREASRSVTAFLHGARDRAIRLGRPVGVRIDRLTIPVGSAGQNRVIAAAATTLTYVEAPDPYSGDTVDSVAFPWIDSMDNSGGVKLRVAFWPPLSPGIVRQGDLLQLNGQNRYYQVLGPPQTGLQAEMAQLVDVVSNTVPVQLPNGSTLTSPYIIVETFDEGHVDFVSNSGLRPSSLPWPYWSSPVPPAPPVRFIFHRKPQAAAGSPIQVPDSVVIDLAGSGLDRPGTGEAGNEFHWTSAIANVTKELPVTIMFAPSGRVDRVFYPSQTQSPATNTTTYSFGVAPAVNTCLLIGRIDHLPDANDTSRILNWQLSEALWVTISPQGRIQSNPNAHQVVDRTTTWATQLRAARSYARQAESIGGR